MSSVRNYSVCHARRASGTHAAAPLPVQVQATQKSVLDITEVYVVDGNKRHMKAFDREHRVVVARLLSDDGADLASVTNTTHEGHVLFTTLILHSPKVWPGMGQGLGQGQGQWQGQSESPQGSWTPPPPPHSHVPLSRPVPVLWMCFDWGFCSLGPTRHLLWGGGGHGSSDRRGAGWCNGLPCPWAKFFVGPWRQKKSCVYGGAPQKVP